MSLPAGPDCEGFSCRYYLQMDEKFLGRLEKRLGSQRAHERLKFEADHRAQVFGQGLTFFHLENRFSAPAIIRTALTFMGLYERARRNAGHA
ncbi:hypothetical protein [Bradyrhizobium icense]|uniref:hypothetical protein n=1 Tax=Bradyrhizobium icense TaxID=1274631 RepID=UPI001F2AB206|nr:hypothetical protein [Bradyrhizobium icense]